MAQDTAYRGTGDMGYQIITSEYPDEVERSVNSWIEHGWSPIGGVCHDGRFFSQAIHKSDDTFGKEFKELCNRVLDIANRVGA